MEISIFKTFLSNCTYCQAFFRSFKIKKNIITIENKVNEQAIKIETLNNEIIKNNNEIKVLYNFKLKLNDKWKEKFGEEIIPSEELTKNEIK